MTRNEWLGLPRDIREAIRKVESKARDRAIRYGCRTAGPGNPRLYLRMLEIYRGCYVLNAMGGERYEVDHVRPLARGGRHHPDNLAVIPMTENRTKGCRYV